MPSNWDLMVIVMSLAVIVTSVYGFVKLKSAGCLIMALVWTVTLSVAISHPQPIAPFCK